MDILDAWPSKPRGASLHQEALGPRRATRGRVEGIRQMTKLGRGTRFLGFLPAYTSPTVWRKFLGEQTMAEYSFGDYLRRTAQLVTEVVPQAR